MNIEDMPIEPLNKVIEDLVVLGKKIEQMFNREDSEK